MSSTMSIKNTNLSVYFSGALLGQPPGEVLPAKNLCTNMIIILVSAHGRHYSFLSEKRKLVKENLKEENLLRILKKDQRPKSKIAQHSIRKTFLDHNDTTSQHEAERETVRRRSKAARHLDKHKGQGREKCLLASTRGRKVSLPVLQMLLMLYSLVVTTSEETTSMTEILLWKRLSATHGLGVLSLARAEPGGGDKARLTESWLAPRGGAELGPDGQMFSYRRGTPPSPAGSTTTTSGSSTSSYTAQSSLGTSLMSPAPGRLACMSPIMKSRMLAMASTTPMRSRPTVAPTSNSAAGSIPTWRTLDHKQPIDGVLGRMFNRELRPNTSQDTYEDLRVCKINDTPVLHIDIPLCNRFIMYEKAPATRPACIYTMLFIKWSCLR